MKAVLAALALLGAAPAAAQDARYDMAVAARLAGDPTRAVSLLDAVLAERPDNVDARLQLGLARLALDDLDAAEAAFAAVLAAAPDYTDARIGLARVAQRRGDGAAADALLADLPPGNADAEALRRQLAGAPPRPWRIDFDARYSRLGGGRPDWREAGIAVAHAPDADTAFAARIDHAERFGLSDTYFEATAERRFTPGLRGYVLAGAAPGADFRPRWQVGLGGAAALGEVPGATEATLDLRQARYPAGDVQTVTPGIVQPIASNARISARWINLFERGGHEMGWLARADVELGDVALFVGLADAPDLSAGVVTETFSLFGGVSVPVSETLRLRLSLTHEDRDAAGRRSEIGLGLGWAF